MLRHKSSRRGGRGRMFAATAFVIPRIVTCDEAQLSEMWLNMCLPLGSNEWIPHFALLAHTILLHLQNCLYLKPLVFSLLFFPICPHPAGQEEWKSEQAAGGCLVFRVLSLVKPPDIQTIPTRSQMHVWSIWFLWRNSIELGILLGCRHIFFPQSCHLKLTVVYW